jgi:hypothetical protein
VDGVVYIIDQAGLGMIQATAELQRLTAEVESLRETQSGDDLKQENERLKLELGQVRAESEATRQENGRLRAELLQGTT